MIRLALALTLLLAGCVGPQLVLEKQRGEVMRAHTPAATLSLWPLSDSLLILDTLTLLPEWERILDHPGTWRQHMLAAGILSHYESPAHLARRDARHRRVAAERQRHLREYLAGERK